MWYENPADIFRLATFVQNDIDPKDGSDATYAFAHVADFKEPILNTVADLWMRGGTRKIFLHAQAPGYPYGGPKGHPNHYSFEEWRDGLVTRTRMDPTQKDGIEYITSPLPASAEEKFPVSHTGTEADLFVQVAKDWKFKTVHVVAHYIHLLRAFTSTVTFALKNYPNLKVYAKPGFPAQLWQEHVVANQGVVRGTRFEGSLDAEWERINKWYGNRYDLAPASEIIKYVKWRDP